MSPLFHSPTQAWVPVDHISALPTVIPQRFLVTVAGREVKEGPRFLRVGKTSSVGTFSPKVRLILFIFLRFASVSFWWKMVWEVGVIGLMGKSPKWEVRGVGTGLSWDFAMRWSSGETTIGLR